MEFTLESIREFPNLFLPVYPLVRDEEDER
jgi:hypothetical protein